jgi:catechol 2,3-dioxygenase
MGASPLGEKSELGPKSYNRRWEKEALNMIRIQKIGHVGLYCKDVKKMAQFYTEVLGFKVSDTNPKGNMFLRFGNDHHNLFLTPANQNEGKGETSLNHIAFEVATLEELKKAKKYLESKGVKILGDGKILHRPTGANYDFDFLDPEGNTVQFYAEMDQIGWDGKARPPELRREFVVEDD